MARYQWEARWHAFKYNMGESRRGWQELHRWVMNDAHWLVRVVAVSWPFGLVFLMLVFSM